jgi:hypothetical protein
MPTDLDKKVDAQYLAHDILENFRPGARSEENVVKLAKLVMELLS